MNDRVRRTMLGLLLPATFVPWPARAQYEDRDNLTEIALSGETPESIILLWPTFSHRLARQMISRYGLPVDSTDERVVWRDNGPWKRIVVYRNPPDDGLFRKSRGRLEQSVAYELTPGRAAALAEFDKSIEADEKAGLLTARTDDESSNILALNLADEVLRGRRTA
ncbi:MAG: hypothetical protein Q7J64_01665 [Elusimicrobiota bacterium]|nr:hypothetical protein [Elusimicrobiota bacterium]